MLLPLQANPRECRQLEHAHGHGTCGMCACGGAWHMACAIWHVHVHVELVVRHACGPHVHVHVELVVRHACGPHVHVHVHVHVTFAARPLPGCGRLSHGGGGGAGVDQRRDGSG